MLRYLFADLDRKLGRGISCLIYLGGILLRYFGLFLVQQPLMISLSIIVTLCILCCTELSHWVMRMSTSLVQQELLLVEKPVGLLEK